MPAIYYSLHRTVFLVLVLLVLPYQHTALPLLSLQHVEGHGGVDVAKVGAADDSDEEASPSHRRGSAVWVTTGTPV